MTRQIFEYHPVTGYRFIPGIRARIPHEGGGCLMRTNNLGFRCHHDFRDAKTPGFKRVLLFGDSFTAGEGVSDGFRFGDLIEDTIRDVELFNFGLPGTGTDQQYLAYREFCGNMDFDMLVIVILVENIQRIVSHYRQNYDEDGGIALYEKPYFTLSGQGLVAMNVPPSKRRVDELSLDEDEKKMVYRGAACAQFPGVTKIIRRWPGVEKFLRKLTGRHLWPYYNNPCSYEWRLMAAILREWINGCRKPVMVMPLPDYLYIEGHDSPAAYQRRFSALARDLGCYYHDPLPAFLEYSVAARRQFRFKSDGHYTKQGHEVVAMSLGSEIARILDGKS